MTKNRPTHPLIHLYFINYLPQGWPKMGSVLFATLFVALQFATGLANPDSKRLYDDLLSNYNRLIRPVGNNSDRLTVKMGLRLSQLIDVVSIRNPSSSFSILPITIAFVVPLLYVFIYHPLSNSVSHRPLIYSGSSIH